MSETKVICFANNKGGSGKSTTCGNVGYALSLMGKKVLLIDGDMQMNLSLSYFDEESVFQMATGEKNLFKLMQGSVKVRDCIVPTAYEGVDLIPSSSLMSGIEFELFPKMQREFIFRKALSGLVSEGVYDYILVDAPPTLGTWVVNILAASDGVIIPVEASPWGLFGLANMCEFVDGIREIAPKLQILGIAITKVSERKNYFRQTLETLKDSGLHVFASYVRVDVNVEKAQDESKPVLVYNKKARSSQEFLELAKEVDEKCR